MLGPNTMTDEETHTADELKNNLTPVSTPHELPYFGNIEQSETSIKSSADSLESITDSIITAEEPLLKKDEMSEEGSSTPK
ncbi:hypothetical protein Moror_681 [Moniliophthora roreri MCA 2997]|uniref:Uncharacterized protein n=1 Tax=Moniliophthora roreri (strain MCA 2997) TaxID=1381753 RepID=V2WJY7_MONRO|nr:hypothetical protein Moror_681 [Moniliophthora roreri MCA 2997]